MKKKNLLLIATIVFVVASIATPLLGLALLEPSYSNMFLITIIFVLASVGSVAYCDLWIEERRKEAQFEEDIKKAFKIHTRKEIKEMFKKIDNQ